MIVEIVLSYIALLLTLLAVRTYRTGSRPRASLPRVQNHHRAAAAAFVEANHSTHDADLKARIAQEKAEQLASK